MRMILGSYTFSRNPNRAPLLTPVRHCAEVATHNGVAFFSWGLLTAGKKPRLEWDLCETAQYDAMEAIYLADAPVLWTPQDGNGKRYTVEIMKFDGSLFMRLGKWWRKDVHMDLLVMDEGEVIP